MQTLFRQLDNLAAIETEKRFARMLERIAFVFMILMFVFAPHSIAATQIAWLTGMFAWFIRQFLKPRPHLVRTPLDVPLWIFFAWSVITSIFSYDPPTSLDKLRNVALFLIFYYIINLVKTKRAAFFLSSTLILSAMVSVLWMPIERIFGRGVEISNVSAASLFSKTILTNGDTLLKANGVKVETPEQLLAEIEKNETTQIYFYRPDFYLTVPVSRADLLDGTNALEKLGIGSWKHSRNWRSMGFLSHYETYAEILQLIISLTFGLFIAGFIKGKGENSSDSNKAEKYLFNLPFSPTLFFCVAAMSLALLLTGTRAAQIGFLISAFAGVFISGNRKLLLITAAVVVPIALGAVYFVQQSRNVGFFDSNDESTKDRLTFYRKGFDLWTANARNFAIGVGMDSTKRNIKEWNLYDNHGEPMGHFHSTPLQLVVERGLPALFLWFWVLWVYGRTLLRWLKIQGSGFRVRDSGFGIQGAGFRIQNSGFRVQESEMNPESETLNPESEILNPGSEILNPEPRPLNPNSTAWREKGIVLGAFGGLVGFISAGLVQYNLGTAMAAMVFFMIMGLSFVVIIPSLRNSSLPEK